VDDSQALAETVAAPPGAISQPSAPAVAALEGAQLDHFRIESLLGRGGMGEVYDATDTSLDRSVALKVLRAEVTEHAAMTERFMIEARAQARFNHPNIVHIYYIGTRPTEADGPDSLFFAMERVDGGDLQDMLNAGDRKSVV